MNTHVTRSVAGRTAILAVLAAGALASCTSSPSASGGSSAGSSGAGSAAASPAVTAAPSSTPPPTSSQAGSGAAAAAVNPAAIPIGDGHVSTVPKVGYVDSCVTNFRRQPNADGPWMNTSTNTWDSLTKPSSAGSVTWPNANYTVTFSGDTRTIVTDDLPIDHPTGVFPVTSADPTSQWDHNPNSVVADPTTITLPLSPSAAAAPSCVGMGPIGVLNDGVFLFNALDAAGADGGAHEIFDQWGEHPDNPGTIHHHFVPRFMLDAVSHAPGSSTLVGYAADGYGIYVQYNSSGQLVTNADLDACHGTTSPVLWNGKVQSVYHYDATIEYPYTVGCFHGTPDRSFSSTRGAHSNL